MYARGESRQRAMLTALARLTPDVPEARAIAKELNGANADALYAEGLEALKRGDAAAAVAPLREALELDPKLFRAHVQLGDALLALDKPRSAAESYRRAIELEPKIVDARIALAEALLKSQQTAVAESTLREGLAISPTSPELNLTLGILLRATGQAAEAKPFLDRASRLGLRP